MSMILKPYFFDIQKMACKQQIPQNALVILEKKEST
jgi:hypothetical protein